jgi:glyceraldehyde-3-phosphate dehydrogenase (ferredoxin)
MDQHQKVLFVDAKTGFYKISRYPLKDFLGPVDLGLHLANKYNSLNIGAGIFAGSILPGSNRLIFTGYSPCWGGFYISSMGGAALVFDNLGINMISIIGKADKPSILYLNRTHGEEIDLRIETAMVHHIWEGGRGGIYSLIDYVFEHFAGEYSNEPRILATGPASEVSDIGAIMSVPITKGKPSFVDTWAGRGGLGSKMLREHGIAAVIYGGTFIDEDFTNKSVADEWFQNKYSKKLAAKDLEDTTKYRFDPKFDTGGTFGVNFASLGGRMLCFNYKSIYMDEAERLDIHKNLVVDHYLKQFNEETIKTKSFRSCGEPCVAVCKKMNGEYKKDYEPYQTMGPLCGIFDQRAAEKLNHTADMFGFDGISIGGYLAWIMECMAEKIFTKEELGVTKEPIFAPESFAVETDSMNNADLGVELLNAIVQKKDPVSLEQGARKLVRRHAREKGAKAIDSFLYTAFGRTGWMIPNQYWSPGVLSPMPIMGKYYMHYAEDFLPPRELGRKNADRFTKELILDNLGICRFHRKWGEEMLPEIVDSVFGMQSDLAGKAKITASRINSRNSSVFWESERNFDYIVSFLKRKRDIEGSKDPELLKWIDAFDKDKKEAALAYWYEIHKGVHESLREFA